MSLPWPHQFRGDCARLLAGVLATLGRTVDRPDISDAALPKSDSSPPAVRAESRAEMASRSSSDGEVINAGSGGSVPTTGLPGLAHRDLERDSRASSRKTVVRPRRSPTTSRKVLADAGRDIPMSACNRYRTLPNAWSRRFQPLHLALSLLCRGPPVDPCA